MTDPVRCGHNDHTMTRRRHMVGARELKTRLGSFLARVRKGETLIVTDRGRPVAELRPIPLGTTPEESSLEGLVALGVLTRLSKKPLQSFDPATVQGKQVSETVSEDREDRF